jgi:hypothetical protein
MPFLFNLGDHVATTNILGNIVPYFTFACNPFIGKLAQLNA